MDFQLPKFRILMFLRVSGNKDNCFPREESLSVFIIWQQSYARSDWLFSCSDWALFSCDDQALLARCPGHIPSVFNLIVDIVLDIHVMVN